MKSMTTFFLAIALLCSTFPALGEPGVELTYLSTRFNIPEGVSAVVSMDASTIGMIGPIDSNLLAAYRTLQDKSVATTLFIDSGGGDVSSAIAIADDLRKHGTRLVVAGKCFSACANYVFTGALRKSVLPGSLIGIHSSQLQYYANNKTVIVPQRHLQQMANLDVDGRIKKQLREKTRLEEDFYSRIGLSKENFRVFESYQLRLEDSVGKKYTGCRKIDLWILSKTELENMDIGGMKGIWTPTTPQEVAAISKNLGLNPANVFFGSAQQLRSACKKTV